MCGLLTPMPAGFLISFLIAVEGCFVLANLFGTQSGASSILPGLQQDNPYRNVQLVLLEAVGIADLVACVALMVGLWLTRKYMPKLVRRFLDVTQVRVALCSVGLTLGFRAVLLVAVAPWLGFMMAFDNRNNGDIRVMLMVLYLALSTYIVWIIVNIFMDALEATQRLQERLTQMDAEERQNLLGQAYASGWPCPTEDMPKLMEVSPTLFGCLPLEPVVLLYMGATLVASVWWLVDNFLNGGGSGGWAFFTRLPQVKSTLTIEIFIYMMTIVASFLALGVMFFQSHRDRDDPWRKHKRRTFTTLIYFVVSCMRFAFFFPVTGMAIAAKDVCSMYSRGLSDLSLNTYVIAPLHCSAEDFLTLLSVSVTFVLDAYLIWGVLKLWQTIRTEYVIGGQVEAASKALNNDPPMNGWGATQRFSYGAPGTARPG